MPDLEKLALSVVQPNAMGGFHIEADAGDVAPDFRAGFGAAMLVVDLEIAAAKGSVLAGDQAEAVVASDLVHLADCRPEIMEILIGCPKGGIDRDAAFPALIGSTFPVPTDLFGPAGAARTDPGGGYDMLNFDPRGALAIVEAFIAASFEVRAAIGVERAGAVERFALIYEHLIIEGPLDGGIAIQR